jgi:hypothetical protein
MELERLRALLDKARPPKKLPLSLVKLPWEFMANCSASIANELSQRQCIRPEPDDGAVSHTGEVQVFYVGRSL